jgi:ActR/RegA family two-component response regulator
MLLQGSLPRAIRLHVDEVPEELAVHANYTELQQALLNLCLNAIQAMPDGGTLTLAANREEVDGAEQVSLCVSDTGSGMDAQIQAQLFTPFFSTKSDGTGLGLMSCKRIVESYQGRIEVHSEAGIGSTFELKLPVRQSAGDTLEAAAGRGQRILVVDGDGTRLSLVGHALSSQGYDPLLAHDAVMALRIPGIEMPELLIVDSDILHAPASNLLRELRARGYAGPVIALHGTAVAPVADEPAGDGSVQMLHKPLRMGHVFEAVERALRSTRSV